MPRNKIGPARAKAPDFVDPQRVTLRLPADVADWCTSVAALCGLTQTEIVRELMRQGAGPLRTVFRAAGVDIAAMPPLPAAASK